MSPYAPHGKPFHYYFRKKRSFLIKSSAWSKTQNATTKYYISPGINGFSKKYELCPRTKNPHPRLPPLFLTISKIATKKVDQNQKPHLNMQSYPPKKEN